MRSRPVSRHRLDRGAAPSHAAGPDHSSEKFALHLLRRVTFGITPELRADVQRAGGALAWLERQFDPGSIDDAACAAGLAAWPLAHADPQVNSATMGAGNVTSMEDLVRATLARQIFSRRQVFEVMVDFWSNHLNITCPSGTVWATKAWDDRHVVRAHALGRFEDMLQASVTSPAMLQYLNNAQSRGDAVNENYARELLELHTLGLASGYRHRDIVNTARALSGLSVWERADQGTGLTLGTFRYRPEWHYVGPVSVLGWSHPNRDAADGVAVARSLIAYLARHPATAERIATKLAVRFVRDQPPAALVRRLARVYLDSDTAIVPVLRALFRSAEFAAAVGAKTRRPAENVIAAWRALGVELIPGWLNRNNAVAQLRWTLGEMGNAPLGWPAPDGYPDVARAWGGPGLTLTTWNAHLAAASGRPNNGVLWPDPVARLLDGAVPATHGGLIDALTARLLPGQRIAPVHRRALLAFLADAAPVADPSAWRPADLKALLPVLVALVLDSPYWSVR